MGIPHELFEEKLEAMKIEKGLRNDTELSVRDLEELFFFAKEDLEELVSQHKNVYVVAKGKQFPSGIVVRFTT
jgi:pyruvate, orthophosphate dikinase